MRSTGQLPEVSSPVIGELEQAQRSLDQLLILGRSEDQRPVPGGGWGIAIDDELEVGSGYQRAIELEQADAGEIGRSRSFRGQGIAGHHRLIRARRLGFPAQTGQAACHPVLRAGCNGVVEVRGENAVEIEDGGIVLTTAVLDLSDQELRPRADVCALVVPPDASEEGDGGIRSPGQEHRRRRTERGLAANLLFTGAFGHASELLGRALVVPAGEEHVGLGQSGRIGHG